MKRDVLVVNGMTCAACSGTVEKYVSKQKGVSSAVVNLILGTLTVTYDDSLSRDDIAKFIEMSGYKYGGVFDPNKDLNTNKTNNRLLIIFGVLLVILLYLSMGGMIGLPTISNMIVLASITCIFSIIYMIYGRDILKVGYKSLLLKDPNMDSLVLIGVVANFIYSFINLILLYLGHHTMNNLYFESICTIIYFVKLGEAIESSGRDKTKDAIKEMVTMTPSITHVLVDGKIKEISIDSIKKGDILCASQGERIAVDGIVTKGESHVDSSFVSGEAAPVKIKKGSQVLASSINLDTYIEYKAENIGPKSTISEIIHMVIDSSNNKTTVEKKADLYSSYFTKAILLISLLTFLIYIIVTKDFNKSLTHFVSVLVVACPCALGLASPLALMTSNNTSLKNKILLRNSIPLEITKNIDTIIFDKTGTLTEGKITLDKINNYSKMSDENVLEIISSLEHLSTHPLARIFDKYNYLKVKDFKNSSNGLEGIVNSTKFYIGNIKYIEKYVKIEKDKDASFYLANNKTVLAAIYVKDKVRREASKLIKDLHNRNIKTIMLTGDNEVAANIVSKSLGIDEFYSSLMPKDKIDFIKKEKKTHKIMMVGDGINDAPSLEEADVGVSLSNSTSIATNAANVILLNNDLMDIIKLINISNRTVKIINENLIWAFFYNALMIPIACGLTKINLSPSISSIAMCMSSLSVVLNSLRLKKGGK